MNPAAEDHTAALPVDIPAMRETAQIMLSPDAVAPPAEELATLTTMMRGHLQLLAPEVEQAARRLRPGSAPRYTALEWVWQAQSRLEAEPTARTGGAAGHARHLARTLDGLCDQYEKLGGGQ